MKLIFGDLLLIKYSILISWNSNVMFSMNEKMVYYVQSGLSHPKMMPTIKWATVNKMDRL